MKKNRSSKKTLAFTGRTDAPAEDLDFAMLRRKIRNRVGQGALEMVESTIGAVNNGQYAALKYLFEAVGLFPIGSSEQDRQQDVLAPTLLQALGLPELPNVERTVTKDSERGPSHSPAIP